MANETKNEAAEGTRVRIVDSAAGVVGATGSVYYVYPTGDAVSIQLDPAFREDAEDDGIREVKWADVAVSPAIPARAEDDPRPYVNESATPLCATGRPLRIQRRPVAAPVCGECGRYRVAATGDLCVTCRAKAKYARRTK